MKKYIAVLIAVLLLSGCTAAPSVTTAPPPETAIPTESTVPTETTLPPVTTAPVETTIPPETTLPIDPTEAEIHSVVEAFLTAYEENCYLYTDHEYDHLTVLNADADTTVSYDGKSVSLSEFHGNIQFLHEEEEYWKETRQEQGINRNNFEYFIHYGTFTHDGDSVRVMVEFAMSFTYEDKPGTTSGGRDEFEILLVQAGGSWLIAGLKTVGN